MQESLNFPVALQPIHLHLHAGERDAVTCLFNIRTATVVTFAILPLI